MTMQNQPQLDWYIVNTKPKQEFQAEKNLKTQGIAAYLPVYQKKIKKNREKIEVLTPPFQRVSLRPVRHPGVLPPGPVHPGSQNHPRQ